MRTFFLKIFMWNWRWFLNFLHEISLEIFLVSQIFKGIKWEKFFIGDFHVKLKVSFEFFTRDFPGKKIEWKKFLKGFLWKIEAGFTPALVLHVLYFPLKLSLIVSEEAISSRQRPPSPETRTSEAIVKWKWSEWVSEWSEWSEVKWVNPKWSFNFYETYICYRTCSNLNRYTSSLCKTKVLWV